MTEDARGDVDVDVVVVGAGFSGLAAAAALHEAGREVVILERADDVGGCWRDNTYPGCQCDVPSNLYSYSFLRKSDWSRTHAPRREILAYLRDAVDRLGLRERLRLGCELLEARWNEARGCWQLETSTGPLSARWLVSGSGPLAEPKLPDVRGLERFRGETMHTARWRDDVELRGRRVALVGTGASAIQVGPRLQHHVSKLVVVQRTPPWVLPHRDRPVAPLERQAFRHVPVLQRAARALAFWGREALVPAFTRSGTGLRLVERVARRHLERGISDPQLRERLTPTYRAGCKRLLLSDDWYPALAEHNVDVVTAPLVELREHSIVTGDGAEHNVDVVVFATGFEVTDVPISHRVHGRGGRSLAEVWDGSPCAYRGTTVAGFPNLFLLVGPNTGLGHNSIVFMAECQVRWIRDVLRLARRRGATVVDTVESAQVAWDGMVQRRMARTVWTTGGCSSWYLDRHGRNSTLWPGSAWRYRRLLARVEARDLVMR